jgi:hypothetical protein
MRIAALIASLLAFSLSAVAQPKRNEFTLSVGTGVEVCEAYLKRLNEAEFTTFPYCDRPEDDRVAGFEKLNRVPLTVDEAVRLFPEADGLITYGDVQHHSQVDARRSERGLPPADNGARSYASDNQARVDQGVLPLSYRFEPRVDIDNDGHAEDVVVWKQFSWPCGAINGRNPRPQRGTTHLLVLDDSGRLDEERTRAIFGHPRGDILTYTHDAGRTRTLDLSSHFRTVGNTYGVLSFRGETYFDTFYGSLGDLRNERVGQPGIVNTLAVLQRSGDQAALVCELVWQEPQ